MHIRCRWGVALLLFTLTGCLSPLTDRLDRLSQRMESIENKLDESNQHLKKLAGDE